MPSELGSNGFQYDRERVPTEDLAVILERFCEAWERERPLYGATGFQKAEEGRYMGAVQYICEKTGLQERRIGGIMRRETLTTSWWMADLILTRIGLQHRLDDIRLLPYEVSRIASNGVSLGHGKGQRRRFANNEEWLDYLDRIGCRR